MKKEFKKELELLINTYSKENGSDTPDFILAEYISDCLLTFDKTVAAREKWYGREKIRVSAPSEVLKEAILGDEVILGASTKKTWRD